MGMVSDTVRRRESRGKRYDAHICLINDAKMLLPCQRLLERVLKSLCHESGRLRAEPTEDHTGRSGHSAPKDQISKILIERQEEAAFSLSVRSDRLVCRPFRHLGNPHHVMAIVAQRLHGESRDVLVRKEPCHGLRVLRQRVDTLELQGFCCVVEGSQHVVPA